MECELRSCKIKLFLPQQKNNLKNPLWPLAEGDPVEQEAIMAIWSSYSGLRSVWWVGAEE